VGQKEGKTFWMKLGLNGTPKKQDDRKCLRGYKNTIHSLENANVPRHYKNDPELASCVANQRVIFKQMSMVKGRVKKLDSIGFVWSFTD
jgi:Helicase associated domain